ncbi:unnamed protein product [Mycena citricolor]|uniref:J domain-containing protein n=1 Tax=Mycena citricolor TaxID=2018698 RepID=A0AAD2GXA5_9AGAR|nr:unnamed protein product [Mycena citricolor]CAK5281474.1 unnamed protein product [Mycena citricolor]
MLLSGFRPVLRLPRLHTRQFALKEPSLAFPTRPNPLPHQIFHLPRNASPAEVKARYFELVRIYHPDKADPSVSSADAHARFRAITAAYNALRDPSPQSLEGESGAPTLRARALYKRNRNLYSGNELADDGWKDKMIFVGVLMVGKCAGVVLFAVQSASTRRSIITESITANRPPGVAQHDARLSEEVRLSADKTAA